MRQSDWDDIIDSSVESDETFEDGLDPIQIATARIEQGNLYKMIIDQDIFEGVNANPEILDKVRREIVQFATSRLEILLGIRKVERKANLTSPISLDEEEILLLKALLSKIKNKEQVVSINEKDLSHQKEVSKLKPIQGPKEVAKNISVDQKVYKKNTVNSAKINKKNAEESVVEDDENSGSNNKNSALQNARATISELKKERDIILNNVQKRNNEWTDEERRRFREISEAIEEYSRPRAHPSFYKPKPSINEENAISTARAELLSRNLDQIIKSSG